ncbi:MAG: hypothetical protein SFV81_29170 [Pirellulaceae bacterium]|nr:hypothetical protein [Pirellulaceae bacterium]
MISVVLYGRNDSYGYNLHKRAALSINCMSEVLTEVDDELLFVDYNTPDDFPTFPEAIQDTLTDVAKERLRILRVRPSVHERFRSKSHLIALEPIARNVAVRHSNPNNRWVLSTNTDMIFVPHEGTSLSKYVKDLPRGFYHLPRFEIPETLWETFNRQDAVGTIDMIREWAQIAHLNEIVTGSEFIRFDAPGDFQLIERDDLFRIHGFNESMLLGWHVDSNIAKRLHLIYGETRDLMNCVFGYHCDHTRQVTPMHRKDSKSNDLGVFVDNVTRPECPEQATTWGCAEDEIEEIRLSNTRNRIYLNSIKACIPNKMTEPTYSHYIMNSYNKVSYDEGHILPFLADIFVNAPPKVRLGWVGSNPELFKMFAALWPDINPGGTILAYEPTEGQQLPTSNKTSDLEEFANSVDAFVFDYKATPESASAVEKQSLLAEIRYAFIKLAQMEQALAAPIPRRFVVVNAIHNAFEQIANAYLHTARTPFSSRIRQGFVVKVSEEASAWADRMQVGNAGQKEGAIIRTLGAKSGLVTYGPYAPILEGKYRVDLQIATRKLLRASRVKEWLQGPAKIKLVAGDQVLAKRYLKSEELYDGKITMQFSCKEKAFLEVKVWTTGAHEFEIRNIATERIA